jgi:hypothetical protein
VNDSEAPIANKDDRHAVGVAQKDRHAGGSADDGVRPLASTSLRRAHRRVCRRRDDDDMCAMDLSWVYEPLREGFGAKSAQGTMAVLSYSSWIIAAGVTEVERRIGRLRYAPCALSERKVDPAKTSGVRKQPYSLGQQMH